MICKRSISRDTDLEARISDDEDGGVPLDINYITFRSRQSKELSGVQAEGVSAGTWHNQRVGPSGRQSTSERVGHKDPSKFQRSSRGIPIEPGHRRETLEITEPRSKAGPMASQHAYLPSGEDLEEILFQKKEASRCSFSKAPYNWSPSSSSSSSSSSSASSSSRVSGDGGLLDIQGQVPVEGLSHPCGRESDGLIPLCAGCGSCYHQRWDCDALCGYCGVLQHAQAYCWDFRRDMERLQSQ